MARKPKETLGRKAGKVALAAAGAAGSAYIAAEAYKRCTTPQQKKKWESTVKTHHGEAGAWMAGIAAVLAAVGISLMLHDREDSEKWFSGDKHEMY